MEQDRQQQTQGGQTFHAPQTDTWANGQPPSGNRPEGAALQQELEQQLRAFGASLSDGFRYGFEGRGGEFGARAKNIGYAVTDLVNYGLSQGQKAANAARARQGGYAAAPAAGGTAAAAAPWNARKGPLFAAANARFGVGLAQVIVGGIFLFLFGLGGLICTGLGAVSWTVLVVGLSLLAAALPFLWLTIRGAQGLSASALLKRYDAAAGAAEAVPTALLAQASQTPPEQTVRGLRKMLRRGWLNAWLSADGGMLYLTQGAYQKACAQARQAQTAEQPERPAAENVTLAEMENFVAVLGSEKQMMADEPQAAEELDRLEQTSTTILGWLRAHPESMPKARRLASYYIPTTLKLLHTYNDVRMQGGDNAASIRRDIAGILHTLNTAFSNLQETLLSDVALDVSSEIAALQGMLAQDGLAQDPLAQPGGEEKPR